MPLYNCFTNNETTHIHLTPNGIVDEMNSEYTVWAVPVALNRYYQIFVSSPSTVMIKGAFLNNFGRVKMFSNAEEGYLDSLLNETVAIYNDTSYSNPITYRAFTNDKRLVDYSNDFYIIIQVPNNHSGSIAVIEGETLTHNQHMITSREVYLNRDGEYTTGKKWADIIDYDSFNPKVRSSLTIISGKTQLPYSDRLMEYLVNSAIHSSEDIPQNISRIQKELGISEKLGTEKDVWHSIMKYLLYSKHFSYTDSRYVNSINPTAEELSHLSDTKICRAEDGTLLGLKNMRNRRPSNIKVDILGFCDKDMENSLYKYKEV